MSVDGNPDNNRAGQLGRPAHLDVGRQLVQQQHVPLDEDVAHEEAHFEGRDREVGILEEKTRTLRTSPGRGIHN